MKLALACLLLLATVAAVATVASSVEVNPPPAGDFYIRPDMSPATFTGKTGIVKGSLIIETGATLTMEDSTLFIDENVWINIQGTLVMLNSTLAFNCTPRATNDLTVNNKGTLTIRDKDSNMTTTYDRSVLRSTTGLNFNFTAHTGSTITIMYSHIERCGRYNPMSLLPEGVVLRGDNPLIESTSFSLCTAALVLDSLQDARITNCTIDQGMWGIVLRGTAFSQIVDCTISRCSQQGILVRGFQRDMNIARCNVSDCGNEQLAVSTVSGSANVIRECTFGPGDQWGMRVTGSESIEFMNCQVTRCLTGIDLTDSRVSVIGLNVTDCPIALLASGGSLTLLDLNLVNGSCTIEPSTVTELTCVNTMLLDRVDLQASHVLRVKDGGVLDVIDSTLAFGPKGTNATGIVVESAGSIVMVRTVATALPSKTWYIHLEPLCEFDIRECTFSHLGSSTNTKDRGIYAAGTGHLIDVTVEDSDCGIVAGRTQVQMVNITVRRCAVALCSDGLLGRGTLEVENLVVEDCPTVVLAINDGGVQISKSSLALSGDGFNLSNGQATIIDSSVGAPATGQLTAYLTQTSKLTFINSSFTEDFGWGSGENVVSVLWYLELRLFLMDPEGAPLVGGSVTILDSQATPVVIGASTGATGRPARSELRERSITHTGQVLGTPHTVRVSLTGRSDSFTVDMVRSRAEEFALDNVAPSVNIVTPMGGSLLNTSVVTVEGSAIDTVHGQTSVLGELAYRIDGGAWSVEATPVGDDWGFELPVEDGTHTVDVRVKDAVGNAASTNVTFTVDTTAPSLSVLYPAAHVTNKTRLTVLGTTEVGSNAKVNGVDVAVGPTGSFSRDIDLVEGPNTIIVQVMDIAGNVATVTIQVDVDTIAPSVSLDPLPARTNATTVVVSGTKEAGATMFVSGPRPELTNETAFGVTVDLKEGPNQISMESLDAIGNRWYTTLTVTRDSTPPPLNVVRVSEYTRIPRIVVQGTTEKGAIVTVNGIPITNIDGTFSTQVDLVPGANSLIVMSRDDLFNYAPTVSLAVTLDTVPPMLKLTTSRQLSTKLDHALLEGTTDPNMTVKIKVVYGAYSKTYTVVSTSNGSFSQDIELPQIGKHSLTVTIEDLAGNQASETLTFDRTFLEKPPTPNPTSDWFADNWVYLVLVVSVIASVLIFAIILVPSKRQQAARKRLVEAKVAGVRAREAGEDLGTEDDGDVEGDEGAEGDDDRVDDGEAASEDAPEDAEGDPADEGWEEDTGKGDDEADGGGRTG